MNEMMNVKNCITNKYSLYTGFLVLLFILVKIPFLFLPYYWDEAWPYSVAIHTLVDNGLSFLPVAIPPDLSRGHPLVFHFMAASWMKFFGPGFISGHSFSLFISVLLISAIYFFCKAFFSERTAFIASLLFCTQSVFLAQSVFLLPEVMIALWAMLCLYAYFKNNKILYVVFTTLLLLTKESGVVLAGTLLLWGLIRHKLSKKKKPAIIYLLYLALPFVFASCFYILQKIQYGWFFFPHHVGLISLNMDVFSKKLPNVASYLFIYFGRNGFSFFILVSLLLLFFKKTEFSENEKRIFPLFGCFIVLFLIFNSMFFFIPRYLLCAFPLFIIAGAVIIDKAFAQYKLLSVLILAGIIATNIFYCFHNPDKGEFKYMSHVKVHRMIIDFCEEENLFTKNIYANFVVRTDLSEPYAGYLSGKPFKNMQETFSETTDFCIFSNDDIDNHLRERLIKENKIRLVKKIHLNYSWSEIYEVLK